MYVNSIGLQTITATTGTSRQSPQQQDNSRADTEKRSDLRVAPAKGIGKNVDKSV